VRLFEVDWRSIFSILDPVSRLYVLFLVCTGIWSVIASFRLFVATRHLRIENQQVAENNHARLAAQRHNLQELLLLTLLLFGFCFFTELIRGLRGWRYAFCNPQADMSPPFDALLWLSQLSFGVMVLIQCLRWCVSAKLDRVFRNWKQPADFHVS
jgi:hypothetical protein